MQGQSIVQRCLVTLAACASLVSLQARAEGRSPTVPLPPRYVQECGSCHVPYPPAMLPAPSWQRLMQGLERHFGTDAALDAASVQEISQWLQRHAGTYKRVREEPPEDRITRSAWFVRKHRADEVPPQLWQHPQVRSPSNCAACHTQAAQGRFDERDIRLPR